MKDMPSYFTAYDIRGRVPDELNEKIAARIGEAYCETFSPTKVAVGRDMRLSSPALSDASITGILGCGVDVVDLGLCGTEEVYFAAFSQEYEGIDGGIMVTASHNPAEYNGMKIVQKGARPVSANSGLQAIAEKLTKTAETPFVVENQSSHGVCEQRYGKDAYIRHLLSYVNPEILRPLKLVVNPGNGCAGPVIDLLEQHLPFSFIRMHDHPDGTFPNGVPNPLLPQNREETALAVKKHNADLGIAWDGDFDRCFFFDENGRFIEGYYIVAFLGAALLEEHPGETILYDPRLTWNTIETVKRLGGKPVMTRTGHAFIKEKMRSTRAIYGGEMSAHHYFRDFGYCDSGMIPWLLVTQLISSRGKTLSAMVDDMMKDFPVSGEINSKVADPDSVLKKIEQQYGDGYLEYIDGVSVTYDRYRFNIRKSNTEPLLRLNVESRGDKQLLDAKTEELLALIRQE
ncbi:phosphohexomutase domain-containing protein [Desulfogranum japonicum]|uniref:phosphomannomutase/phosphoglucomutase n=1 Tax=Desulfogranum japonicum TaxID=231447 RepID=UPI000411D3E7|nr:phosphomannomutase/phosphoglucomutase [Desulfogranum japonicum]